MPHVRVVHLSVYSVCNFTKTGPTFLIILMISESCSIHTNTYMVNDQPFFGRFHNVSFTMQSHDQNSTLSLSLGIRHQKFSIM